MAFGLSSCGKSDSGGGTSGGAKQASGIEGAAQDAATAGFDRFAQLTQGDGPHRDQAQDEQDNQDEHGWESVVAMGRHSPHLRCGG